MATLPLLSEMGYKQEERIEVKKGFFESYLKLTEQEEELLMDEVSKYQKQIKSSLVENSICYFYCT